MKLITRLIQATRNAPAYKDTARLVSLLQKYPNFRWYEIMQMISAIGTMFQTLFLGIESAHAGVGTLEVSFLAVSCAGFLSSRWQMIFGDRHQPRTVLLFTTGVSAAIAVGLCVLYAWRVHTAEPILWPHVLLPLIAAMLAVIKSISGPAESKVVERIVFAVDLQTARIINYLLPQVAFAVGAGLTAVLTLVQWPWTSTVLLGFNVLSFGFPFVYMWKARFGRAPGENKLNWRKRKDFARLLPRRGQQSAALQSVRVRLHSWWALLLFIAWLVFFQRGLVMAPLAGTVLFGAQGYAVTAMTSSVAAVVGSLILAARAGNPSTLRGLLFAALWGSAFLALYGLGLNLPLAAAGLLFGVPGSEAVMERGWSLVLQGSTTDRTDPAIQGRLRSLIDLVTSIATALANGLAALGLLLLGSGPFGIRATAGGLSALGLVVMAALGTSAVISERRHSILNQSQLGQRSLDELFQLINVTYTMEGALLLLAAVLEQPEAPWYRDLRDAILSRLRSYKEDIYDSARAADGDQARAERQVSESVDPRLTVAILEGLASRSRHAAGAAYTLDWLQEIVWALPEELAMKFLLSVSRPAYRTLESFLGGSNGRIVPTTTTSSEELLRDLPRTMRDARHMLRQVNRAQYMFILQQPGMAAELRRSAAQQQNWALVREQRQADVQARAESVASVVAYAKDQAVRYAKEVMKEVVAVMQAATVALAVMHAKYARTAAITVQTAASNAEGYTSEAAAVAAEAAFTTFAEAAPAIIAQVAKNAALAAKAALAAEKAALAVQEALTTNSVVRAVWTAEEAVKATEQAASEANAVALRAAQNREPWAATAAFQAAQANQKLQAALGELAALKQVPPEVQETPALREALAALATIDEEVAELQSFPVTSDTPCTASAGYLKSLGATNHSCRRSPNGVKFR